MMITAMMSNRATITPITGPAALLPLLLAPVDCCGEVTNKHTSYVTKMLTTSLLTLPYFTI